ncbi:MAG: hypothetical protein JW807_16420 [Spirochaetes bacterium]|nr:hypothetical protein [Spirochaetota bacterium]
MKTVLSSIMLALIISASAPSVFAAPKLDDLITKKTKELLKGYRGQRDLSIAIVDTDKTPISSKITTIAYKVVFNDKRFSIVERELMNQLTKELALQHTGLVQIASQIGRMTGANLILLIRKEETDMRMRIVSVEKGVILAFNFIPLTDIAAAESGGTGPRATQPVIGSTYHSPVLAGLVSIFPVWSGSWNAGWTEWGLALVACKTGSWIAPAVFWFQASAEKKKYNDFNSKARSFFYANPTAFTPENLTLYLLWSGKLQREKDRAQDKFQQSLTYCSIAWAAVTVADIIGSVFYVISRNPQYSLAPPGMELQGLSYSFHNRFGHFSSGPVTRAAPDGLDISVSYHF